MADRLVHNPNTGHVTNLVLVQTATPESPIGSSWFTPRLNTAGDGHVASTTVPSTEDRARVRQAHPPREAHCLERTVPYRVFQDYESDGYSAY